MREAAAANLRAKTNKVTVASSGEGGQRYSYEGLINLPVGSFDLHVVGGAGTRGSVTDLPARLVAVKGAEAVNDVVTRSSPLGELFQIGRRRQCWFSNPFPAQINGGMSIEEGATLIGSVLESLPSEVATAESIGEGLYEVELKASATRPRDIDKPGANRTWGFRGLLADLAGPIEVGIADGRVDSLRLTVDEYRPHYSPGRYRPEPADSAPRDGVPLSATLEASPRQLEVRRPSCVIDT